MNKFLIAAIGLVFLLGSSATMASGNKESALPPMAAQDILNQMACDGKKAGDKIKDRVISGTSNANISFDDLCAMLIREGFTKKTTASSHFIFTRSDVPHIINLQPKKDGKSKPYQVKQVSFIVQNHPKPNEP